MHYFISLALRTFIGGMVGVCAAAFFNLTNYGFAFMVGSTTYLATEVVDYFFDGPRT